MSKLSRDFNEQKIREIVREELSEQLADAGVQHGSSYEEDDDRLAESAMTVSDIRSAEQHGLSPSEALEERYGVTAEDWPNEHQLTERVRKERQNA